MQSRARIKNHIHRRFKTGPPEKGMAYLCDPASWAVIVLSPHRERPSHPPPQGPWRASGVSGERKLRFTACA